MHYRASALSALVAHERYAKLLAALTGLVEEAQPLGIDRPAYKAARAAVVEAENELVDDIANAVLVDEPDHYCQASAFLHFDDVVGVTLSAPRFHDRTYADPHSAEADQALYIWQGNGNKITIMLDRVIQSPPVQFEQMGQVEPEPLDIAPVVSDVDAPVQAGA